ncbi:MAG: hypothetical protein QME58_13735 [Bacteroidota bacterium]|nr:hypothetical protein [Bacteroidota bacterium]
MKFLTFKPTNKLGISNVILSDGFCSKIIGSYNSANQTFFCFRTEKRHLHRSSGSLAINEMVLEIPGLRWLEIAYTDSSGRVQSLKTSKDFLLKFGKKSAFKSTDYEAQIFLPLQLWGLQAAIRFEQQLSSQQSLFEVACG